MLLSHAAIPVANRQDDDRHVAEGDTDGAVAMQEVGDDVILNCSADRQVHLCRWKTPYLNTYIVGEGIYVERGRISWHGTHPDFDCTIRVSKLELKDSGTWVCEIGSNAGPTFQVQTKEFQIRIESKARSLACNVNLKRLLSQSPTPRKRPFLG